MPRYKNIGESPWRRADGKLVPPGATFEATEREHARIQRRSRYQLRVRLTSPAKALSTASDEWPLKMTPANYLKLHSEGKHAPLARQLIAAKEEEGVT